MSFVALFILTASLLATLFAGRIELHVAAIILFAAVFLADVLSVVTTNLAKWHTLATMRAVSDIAQGSPTAKSMMEDAIKKSTVK